MKTGYALCPNSSDQEHTWMVIQTFGGQVVKRLCEHCGCEPTEALIRIDDEDEGSVRPRLYP